LRHVCSYLRECIDEEAGGVTFPLFADRVIFSVIPQSFRLGSGIGINIFKPENKPDVSRVA
jgi:hypothetical protein